MRFLLPVAVLAVIVFLLLTRPSKAQLQQWLKYAAIGGGILLLLVLAATGRLHWLFALIAALLPFLFRLLKLLRYAPLARQLWQWWHRRQAGGSVKADSAGNYSRVKTRFLEMNLDHDSGEMDGEVLNGPDVGKRLSQLDKTSLLRLLAHYQQEDAESAALLEAYLNRVHQDWRDHYQGERHQNYANSADHKMDPKEALEILGLDETASDDDVLQAHRRLMQKIHPDRGGSSWLAAKLNQARDTLLGGS